MYVISMFLTLNGIRIACGLSGLELYLTIDIHIPVLTKTPTQKCIEVFNYHEFELQPDSEIRGFHSDCSNKLSNPLAIAVA